VRGDFAEDVAGENVHFFCCLVMLLQVYRGAAKRCLRGKDLGANALY
jgi:hypothetical protein